MRVVEEYVRVDSSDADDGDDADEDDCDNDDCDIGDLLATIPYNTGNDRTIIKVVATTPNDRKPSTIHPASSVNYINLFSDTSREGRVLALPTCAREH